jgi:hypothetical protein
MPDVDPFASDPLAEAAAEAAEADFLENLTPPDWFYPLVGEVASQTVLLELCMTEAALALTGTQGDAYELIKSSESMVDFIKSAQGRDERFDQLVMPFHSARNDRNKIVHALLRWQESDGDTTDYWVHTHPKTKTATILRFDKPPKSMTSALKRIKDTTQAAFDLTNALIAHCKHSPSDVMPAPDTVASSYGLPAATDADDVWEALPAQCVTAEALPSTLSNNSFSPYASTGK